MKAYMSDGNVRDMLECQRYGIAAIDQAINEAKRILQETEPQERESFYVSINQTLGDQMPHSREILADALEAFLR